MADVSASFNADIDALNELRHAAKSAYLGLAVTLKLVRSRNLIDDFETFDDYLGSFARYLSGFAVDDRIRLDDALKAAEHLLAETRPVSVPLLSERRVFASACAGAAELLFQVMLLAAAEAGVAPSIPKDRDELAAKLVNRWQTPLMLDRWYLFYSDDWRLLADTVSQEIDTAILRLTQAAYQDTNGVPEEPAAEEPSDGDTPEAVGRSQRQDRLDDERPDHVAHSPDFRSLRWFGESYTFTERQSPVVQLLFSAWKAGTPDVGKETLLQAVDHACPPSRLDNQFRNSPAWKKLIVQGATRGTYRLNEPQAMSTK